MTDGYARASATTHDTLAIPMGLSELEQYRFRSADLLCGSIDQANFKAFIFPSIFFKLISDVYTEEHEKALPTAGTKILPPSSRFLWPVARASRTNVDSPASMCYSSDPSG